MAKKEETLESGNEAIGGEPRVYELGFHLDPELPAEEVKKSYQTVRDLIMGASTIVAEGEPEKIQLAYTISRQDVAGRRDFNSAYFCWIAYETTPENHGEIIAAASENQRIIRFIDVLTTKEAARHAVEMRDIAETIAKPDEDADTGSGAELDAVLENIVV
ncbi:30S ribosomal protein S6 [Patescibacteria group bacterium]|nr:30S ribosomal protein S6 [Patescibacteria group bacterium]